MTRRYAQIAQRLGGRCRQTGTHGLEGVLRALTAAPDATSTAQHSFLITRLAANAGSSTAARSLSDVTGSGVPRVQWSLSVFAHPIASAEGLALKRAFHASSGLRMGVAEPSEPEAEQRSPPSDRVVRLVDEIAELNLLEVADLTQLLKRKLGLPDMPMGGMMMPMQGMMPGGAGAAQGAGAGGAQAEEPEQVEKTSFDVKLEKFDASAKLKIIKEVRAITGLGLKESKELVEGAPAVIKKGVPKEEAESLLEKLKAVGAEVSLE